jgi:hypothetical protein
MIRLTHLDLDGPFNDIPHSAVSRNTLAALSNLRRVTITSYDSTDVLNILENLRCLPHIEEIAFRHRAGFDVTTGIRTPGNSRRYPRLKTLRFLQAQPIVILVSLAEYSFDSIETLHLELAAFEKMSLRKIPFSSLSKQIAASCPSLKQLDIQPSIVSDAAFDFDDLFDLIKVLKLEHFSINHRLPLDISLRHIFQISAWWGPTIQHLSLNPTPIKAHAEHFGSGVPQLDLRALMILGHACPRLIDLSLYIDASRPARELRPYPTLPPALQSIDFGCSNIDEPHVSMDFFNTLEPSPSAAIRISGTAVRFWPGSYPPGYVNAVQLFWTMVENMVNLRSRQTPNIGGDIWCRRPLTLTWPSKPPKPLKPAQSRKGSNKEQVNSPEPPPNDQPRTRPIRRTRRF